MSTSNIDLRRVIYIVLAIVLLISSVSCTPKPASSQSSGSGSSGNNQPIPNSSSPNNNQPSSNSPSANSSGGTENNLPPTQSFSIQDANTTTPADVIEEISYGGRGGGVCSGLEKYPTLENDVSSADWLSDISILTCGWANGEQVEITVETPTGDISNQTVRAESSSAYIDYQTSIDSPVGNYTFTFSGNSGKLQQTIDVSTTNGPRMYHVDNIQSYYLYGFSQHEHIRFFSYIPSENAKLSLNGWQDYNVDENGNLLIKAPTTDGFYTAIGDISGPTRNTPFVLNSQGLKNSCSGSLPSHLKTGGYAYVSNNPPLDNRVRQGPGQDQQIVGYIASGHSMQILDGPQCADGYIWWKVQSTRNSNVIGWSAEGDNSTYWLIPCDSLRLMPLI